MDKYVFYRGITVPIFFFLNSDPSHKLLKKTEIQQIKRIHQQSFV